tara:strand:- start:112 stop:549 length:438 start_codon:yes stop_codon:yes gene_type:complete
MIRINYCSRTTNQLDFDEVNEIAKTSSVRNNECDITGFLVFNQNYFVQTLEGPAKAVNDTYHRIAKDKRHKDIMILSYENDIPKRSFAHWDLAYITLRKVSREIYYPFMTSGDFDPYTLNPNSIMPFMHEMFQGLLENDKERQAI